MSIFYCISFFYISVQISFFAIGPQVFNELALKMLYFVFGLSWLNLILFYFILFPLLFWVEANVCKLTVEFINHKNWFIYSVKKYILS